MSNITRKGRILGVQIITRCDDMPDTSYLGKYTNTPEEGAIVCATGEFYEDVVRRTDIIDRAAELAASAERAGEGARATYWTAKAQRLADKWEGVNEIPGGCSREYRFFLPYAGGEKVQSKHYRAYAQQDWERMRGLSAGEWGYVGIMAQAEVTLAGSNVIQRITSGGLWGIESDSGAYLEEVAQSELEELRGVLQTIGFGRRAIAAAFANVAHITK